MSTVGLKKNRGIDEIKTLQKQPEKETYITVYRNSRFKERKELNEVVLLWSILSDVIQRLQLLVAVIMRDPTR